MTQPLSIYRGQSTAGIGEGPDRPNIRGEQFIAAEGPLHDKETLDAVRSWMTLDASGADNDALGERIEGWSYFPLAGRRFLVRLGWAPQYTASDARAAYFSHAQAFSTEDFAEGFDPGALLGRTELFDPPWVGGKRPADARRGDPQSVSEAIDFERVLKEAEPPAQRFLGHLLQSLIQRYAVIVAVPSAEFVTGGLLHKEIAFARAALPLSLKRDCRIRVYTTRPSHFLKEQRADLVVIPEAHVTEALRACRDAVLLDRTGTRREGRELASGVREYADAVVQRSKKLRHALLRFAERVSPHLSSSELPTASQVEKARILFNAIGVADSPDQLGSLLTRRLAERAAEVGPLLPGLLTDEEWRRMPDKALTEILVGRLDLDATEGGRTFLDLVEVAARNRGLCLNTGSLPPDWRAPLDGDHVRRLARLLGGRQGASEQLVSPMLAARLSSATPLQHLASSAPLCPFLRAERASSLLGGREREAAQLASAASEPAVFEELFQATREGQLGFAWVERFIDEAAPRDLLPQAARLLEACRGDVGWRSLLPLLLGRLLALDATPQELGRCAALAALETPPASDLSLHLDLLELTARSGARELSSALDALVRSLPTIVLESDRLLLMDAALGAQRKAPGREVVVDQDGRLRFPEEWDEHVAPLMLADPGAPTLALQSLLRLAPWLLPSADAARRGFAKAIDQAMARDLVGTTRVLIEHDLWLTWRSTAQLDQPTAARDAARAWFTSSAWSSSQPPLGATIESWARALADLGDHSTCAEIQELFGDARRHRPIPSIPPFREEQIAGLARRAVDLDALVELGLAIARTPDLPQLPEAALWTSVLESSRFSGQHRAEALCWLARRAPDQGAPDPALTSDEVRALLDASGRRRGQVMELGRPPGDSFLEGVASWVADLGSCQGLDQPFLIRLERWLPTDGRTARAPALTLSRELQERGFSSAASFFAAASQTRHLALEALGRQRGHEDPCWDLLIAEPPLPGRAPTHPLRGLIDDTRKQLVEGAWRAPPGALATLASAVAVRPALLSASAPGEPLPAMALAALMCGEGTMGGFALLLIERAGTSEALNSESWWASLLVGARGRSLLSGGLVTRDRERWAVPRILGATGLSEAAAAALRRAGDEWKRGERSGRTMYDVVTFFGGPQRDGSHFELEFGPLRRLYVASPSAAPASLRRAKGPEVRAEIEAFLRASGGILADVTIDEKRCSCSLVVFSAAAYRPPATLLLLQPMTAEIVQLQPSFQIPLGAHLIIPIDAVQEAPLASLRESLRGLPPDLEAVVLNTIRGPSLEARLSKVETALLAGPEKPMLSGKIWIGGGALAVGLLFGLMVAFLISSISSTSSSGAAAAGVDAGSVGAATSASAAAHAQPASTALPSSRSVALASDELRQALKASPNEQLKSTYNKTFKDMSYAPKAEKAEQLTAGLVWALVIARDPAKPTEPVQDAALMASLLKGEIPLTVPEAMAIYHHACMVVPPDPAKRAFPVVRVIEKNAPVLKPILPLPCDEIDRSTELIVGGLDSIRKQVLSVDSPVVPAGGAGGGPAALLPPAGKGGSAGAAP